MKILWFFSYIKTSIGFFIVEKKLKLIFFRKKGTVFASIWFFELFFETLLFCVGIVYFCNC